MPNYIQKSYIPKFGNMHNPMDTNIVEDIAYLVDQANSGGGGVNTQQAITDSIWANGFRIVGCIAEDITLPDNSNIQYTGPLAMCLGYTLTVPVGTTLTIV